LGVNVGGEVAWSSVGDVGWRYLPEEKYSGRAGQRGRGYVFVQFTTTVCITQNRIICHLLMLRSHSCNNIISSCPPEADRLSQVACHCRESLTKGSLWEASVASLAVWTQGVTELISRYTLSILVVLVMIQTVYCLLRGHPMKATLLYPLYYLHLTNLTDLTTENCRGRQRPCSVER